MKKKLAVAFGLLAIFVAGVFSGSFYQCELENRKFKAVLCFEAGLRMEFLYLAHQCMSMNKLDEAKTTTRILMALERERLFLWSKYMPPKGSSVFQTRLKEVEPILASNPDSLPKSDYPYTYTKPPESDEPAPPDIPTKSNGRRRILIPSPTGK